MSILTQAATMPVREPIAGPEGRLPRPWVDYFTSLIWQINAAAKRVKVVSLTTQAATIGTTTIPISAVNAGLYRLTYYLRITQAATTSSSATVTLGWPDGSVACSLVASALTGNTTATVQTGTVMVRTDSAGPLTYAVLYASSGATPMQFSFDLVAEEMPL